MVTVQPVRSADPELVAQVILRIPPPLEERFLDPAVMRHAMLDGALRRIGGELDMDQMAPELINIVVPHFCNAAGLLIRESLIGDEDLPAETADGTQLVRRLAVAHDNNDGTWDATFPTGEVLRYPPDTPYTQCMTTGLPVCEIIVERDRGQDRGRVDPQAGLRAAGPELAAGPAPHRPRDHARLLRMHPPARLPPFRRL